MFVPLQIEVSLKQTITPTIFRSFTVFLLVVHKEDIMEHVIYFSMHIVIIKIQ